MECRVLLLYRVLIYDEGRTAKMMNDSLAAPRTSSRQRPIYLLFNGVEQ